MRQFHSRVHESTCVPNNTYKTFNNSFICNGQNYEQPNCPSTVEWLNCGSHIMGYYIA